MISVVDAPRRQAVLQQMHTPQILLGTCLSFPLKRREGLRHKEGRGQVDGEAALFVAGVLAPRLQDLIDKLSDRALFSVEEPEGTSIVIGTARAGHFSWRTENGFHDLDSVMRWLQSHPDYTICDEYGTIETAEEFKQVLDWCGTYISS